MLNCEVPSDKSFFISFTDTPRISLGKNEDINENVVYLFSFDVLSSSFFLLLVSEVRVFSFNVSDLEEFNFLANSDFILIYEIFDYLGK